MAEARWRAVIDAAVDGIIVIDRPRPHRGLQSGGQGMFGYGEAEVIGQNVSMLMPEPRSVSATTAIIKHHLETGERRIIGIGRAVTGLRATARHFPLHLSVGEMEIDGEKHFTGILHDLSRRTSSRIDCVKRPRSRGLAKWRR